MVGRHPLVLFLASASAALGSSETVDEYHARMQPLLLDAFRAQDQTSAWWVGFAHPRHGDHYWTFGNASDRDGAFPPDVPATTDDHFYIGSISKTFAAAVHLQLIEQGTFALEETVASILPEFASTFPKYANYTPADLMGMRTLVPDFLNNPDGFLSELAADPARRFALPELIAFAMAEYPARVPDFLAEWNETIADYDIDVYYPYSTTNILALEYIAENVTGRSMSELVADLVTAPLGLENTVLPFRDAPGGVLPEPVSHSYFGDSCVEEMKGVGYDQQLHDRDDAFVDSIVSVGSGGAMYSTIVDLLQWSKAGLGDDLLEADSVEKRHDFQKHSFGAEYGLGLHRFNLGEQFNGAGWLGHAGDAFGSNTVSFSNDDPTSGAFGAAFASAVTTCGNLRDVHGSAFRILAGDYVGEEEKADVAATARDALAAATALWSSQGLRDYDYHYMRSCECLPAYTERMLLEVRDGTLAAGYYADDEAKAMPDDMTVYTVEEVFDLIREALDRSADGVGVAYNATLGYPMNVYIDYVEMMADDEMILTLSGLTARSGEDNPGAALPTKRPSEAPETSPATNAPTSREAAPPPPDADAAEAFLGIPYATVPARFAPSAWRAALDPRGLVDGAPDPASGAYDAYGPDCYQPALGPPVPGAPPQSEDCLFLNIWRPQADRSLKLPVMVWIHGGGFVTGSGAAPLYDGANLARDGGVLVVTLNYRLGVFGLLATDPATGAGGMNALGDQIQALAWVRAHVAAFGGDPDQVTIFGESIGGVSACLLSVSPEAKGLFRRAVVQSGQCLTDRLAPISVEAGAARTQELLDATKMSSVEDLRSMTAEELLAAGGMDFNNAALDSLIMPQPPLELYQRGPLNPTDMIIGSNTVDDPSMLQPPFLYVQSAGRFEDYLQALFKDPDTTAEILDMYSSYNNNVSAYAHFQGDFLLRCGGRELAAYAANAAEGHVYHYVFTQHTANDIGNGIIAMAGITDTIGWASHTVEVPFVFSNLDYTYLGRAPTPPTEADLALSHDQMMPRWVGFAKAGVPGEDWTAVINTSIDELSQLSTLVISADDTLVRKLPDKQSQCNSIPMYGAEESTAPMSSDAPSAGSKSSTSAPTATGAEESTAPMSSDAPSAGSKSSTSAPTATPDVPSPTTTSAPTIALVSAASSRHVWTFTTPVLMSGLLSLAYWSRF